MRFENKVAFITGGGGYIGYYTSIRLASEGAKVVVCDINEETITKTVKAITSTGGEAFGLTLDVTDSEKVDNAFKAAINKYGKIDIMVHAAGGSARKKMKPLIEQTDDVIMNVLSVNLLGAIYCSRAAARNMVNNKWGRIINLASTIGVVGARSCVEYSAAKGGIISMTKSLAKELGEFGITVNSVAPGIVLRPDETRDITNTNFIGRNCRADEVANLIAFLASDEAAFITGQNYIIDGGRSIALKGTD